MAPAFGSEVQVGFPVAGASEEALIGEVGVHPEVRNQDLVVAGLPLSGRALVPVLAQVLVAALGREEESAAGGLFIMLPLI